jgi:hypothetical protein
VDYFEVKSSINPITTGRMIPISMNELAEAAKRNGSYIVVRVYGCPSNPDRPDYLAVAAIMAAGSKQDSQLASIERPPAAAASNHPMMSQVRLAPGRGVVPDSGTVAAMAAGGKKRRRKSKAQSSTDSKDLCLLFIRNPVQLLKRKVVSLSLNV